MKTRDFQMPVLFVGHGSPMNALELNDITKKWRELGESLPLPRAIAVISAHWETEGTRVCTANPPKTIHDFRGFPEALNRASYPCPGVPETAHALCWLGEGFSPSGDWGLDHGAWSILMHLYPKANIPVFQISLDTTKDPLAHIEVARALAPLRQEQVLIIGSGNIVHNLRQMKWEKKNFAYEWAREFDREIADACSAKDVEKIARLGMSSEPKALQSIQGIEHYLPLVYAMALAENDDVISFPVEGIEHGSLSMRSVLIS
jgi:4,5-DOPA dioxygenase extradiol